MNITEIVIMSLYNHFLRLSKKRKTIIPWFHTCFALALTIAFCFVLLLKTVFYKVYIPQGVNLFIYMGIMLLSFFYFKNYFFKDDRYLALDEKYQEVYSEKEKKLFRIYSIAFCILIPVALIFIIRYQAG